jgi:hypothetical protein
MKFLTFSLFSVKLVVCNGQPHRLWQHLASKPSASVALAARLVLNPFMTSALGGIRREHHRKNNSAPTLRPRWTNCLDPRRRGRTLSISPMRDQWVLCLGDVEPRQAFLWKILSPRLELRGLIERTDMEMRFHWPGETFASQS